jgi:hypothetical protein
MTELNIIPESAWKDRGETMDNITMDSWCSDGDLNKVPPECKFEVLLCQPVWWAEIQMWDHLEMNKECHPLDSDIQCYRVNSE